MTAVDSMRSQLLVQQLHSTKTQLVIFLTGGGSQVPLQRITAIPACCRENVPLQLTGQHQCEYGARLECVTRTQAACLQCNPLNPHDCRQPTVR